MTTHTSPRSNADVTQADAPLPRRWAVAHRGEPRGCIENTLSAIQRAVDLSAHAVEVDVRCTADGVAVLHHDESLSRVWRHPGELARMTFAGLRRLTPSIPTLAEALAAMRPEGPPLLVDVTSVTSARAAYRAVQDAGLTASAPVPRPRPELTPTQRHAAGAADRAEALASSRVWFCGTPSALVALRAHDPSLVLMLSWQHLRPPSPALVDEMSPTFFNPWHGLLTRAIVRGWHERGTLVSAWTVDSPRRRRRLLDWGVDAIISNHVEDTVSQVDASRSPATRSPRLQRAPRSVG